MSVPMIEELRNRVQSRVSEIRTTLRTKIPMLQRLGVSPQIEIGQGKLVERVKTKINEIGTKVQELRPGILPKVVEMKPGSMLTKMLPQVVERENLAVVGEAAKKEFTDALSIEL